MIRDIARAEDFERNIRVADPLNLSRGAHSTAIGVNQKRQQHPRVKPGRADPTATAGRLERRDIEPVNDIEDEPDQMILREQSRISGGRRNN